MSKTYIIYPRVIKNAPKHNNPIELLDEGSQYLLEEFRDEFDGIKRYRHVLMGNYW